MNRTFDNIPLNLATDTIIADFSDNPDLEKTSIQSKIDALTDEERSEYDKYLAILECKRGVIQYYYDKGRYEGMKEGLEKGEAIGMAKCEAIGMAKCEAIGIEKGKAEGIPEGMKKEKLQSIRMMHSFGVPHRQIAEGYGMTEAEIDAIVSQC